MELQCGRKWYPSGPFIGSCAWLHLETLACESQEAAQVAIEEAVRKALTDAQAAFL
jgi:hypothetical protein